TSKEKLCSGTKPIKSPLTGQCINESGDSMKDLYRLRKAHNIIGRYENARKEGKEPSDATKKSIEGAMKIFKDFMTKHPDDYAKLLNKIKVFFTEDETGKQIYSNM